MHLTTQRQNCTKDDKKGKRFGNKPILEETGPIQSYFKRAQRGTETERIESSLKRIVVNQGKVNADVSGKLSGQPDQYRTRKQ